MKKAEIIKNGNVNLKPIKTGIDWISVCHDFWRSKTYTRCLEGVSNSKEITDWFQERIEKELNSSE